MFPRLQRFKSQLTERGLGSKPLFFAKVDVQSCFDTIPQRPLLGMLQSLLTANEYTIGRHAEAKVLGGSRRRYGTESRVTWKFHGRAQPAGEDLTLSQMLNNSDSGDNTGSVFVDAVVREYESKAKIISMLKEHLEQNIVQIGKKYLRQKQGIPQGSIVSSLLCSFFYGELEHQKLGFVRDGESILLRLIDDFLLVSTNEETAKRFVKVMHTGLPQYGVTVKVEKSMVNFDIFINGQAVQRVPAISDFAYCGNTINTVNLNIAKDKGRKSNGRYIRRWLLTRFSHVLAASAITVEHSKVPGQSFYRKTLK